VSLNPRRWLGVARAVFVPFVVVLLQAPVPHLGARVAVAQPLEDRAALGVVPFVRRGDVGVLHAARIEEYLRQMLEAGGAVRLVPARVIETGKPLTPTAPTTGAAPKPVTATGRALDKADTLAITARTMLEEGEDPNDILKLLAAAAQRYEQNYAELADFTKLVDVYAQSAAACLLLKRDDEAKDFVQKALVLQPTFVVDARKSNKQLQTIVTAVRQTLAGKEPTELTVECSQPECEIFVDGVKIGVAPAKAADLYPGIHYVQARKAGAQPWGMTVTAKGKPLSVTAKPVLDDDPSAQAALAVDPADIKAFADSGKFHEKVFKNTVALFTRQVRATHLLYGVVARSTRGLELHLFLVHGQNRKTCALDRVDFNANLTDLQMKTLDAEGRVRAAIGGCSSDHTVTNIPDVYTRATGPTVTAPTIMPTPPESEPPPPEIKPEPELEPRTSEGKPEPKPVVKPRPESMPAPVASDDPYAGLLVTDATTVRKPWYKRGVFWVVTSVVVVAGAGTAVYFARQPTPQPTGFKATAMLP
jgi:hypothetical protein